MGDLQTIPTRLTLRPPAIGLRCAFFAFAIGQTIGATIGLRVVTAAAGAEGNATAGRQVFARCAACHSTAPGQNGIGPSLAGVFGRQSGAGPGYNYSAALKAANMIWDEHTLDQYLANPGMDIHGTKMFISVPNAEDRMDVIAYLQTLK